MATYKRFEGPPAWQAAIDVAINTYALTAKLSFRGQRGLVGQIERAAVSISNNIAEGFERGTTKELLTFLYVARGSAGEARPMRCLIERLPNFTELRLEISDLESKTEGVSRQIRAWAAALQNSSIAGQRHLTETGRRIDGKRRERDEFLAFLRKETRHETRE